MGQISSHGSQCLSRTNWNFSFKLWCAELSTLPLAHRNNPRDTVVIVIKIKVSPLTGSLLDSYCEKCTSKVERRLICKFICKNCFNTIVSPSCKCWQCLTGISSRNSPHLSIVLLRIILFEKFLDFRSNIFLDNSWKLIHGHDDLL